MLKYFSLFMILIGANAHADEVSKWQDVGDWEILVDPAAGNGCLAQRDFEGGIRVQIGAVPSREGGFFAAYHSDWTQIEDGTVGVLNFDFGDARFAGEVVGKLSDALPGGYAFFDNPNFVKEFAQRNTVRVWGEREDVIEISLAGTAKAIDAVLACQKEQPKAVSE